MRNAWRQQSSISGQDESDNEWLDDEQCYCEKAIKFGKNGVTLIREQYESKKLPQHLGIHKLLSN